jgi:hypothetical protein
MREERSGSLPNLERMSALTATILLAFALARFINLPGSTLTVQFAGSDFSIEVDPSALISILIAGLAASGMGWLLQEHPGLGKKTGFEHLLLPALTALVIDLPLRQIPLQPLWWLGFALGGALLILVIVAEYIVVDADDARYPPAAAGLTVLSFALYLVLTTALRFGELRLFELAPVLAGAAGLVSLRVLRLRLPGEWAAIQAGLVALITVQIASALHYWPITPVAFGLALLGPAYALTTLMGNLMEGEPLFSAAIEPGVVLLVLWLAAFFIR